MTSPKMFAVPRTSKRLSPTRKGSHDFASQRLCCLSLSVCRTSVLSKYLRVKQGEENLRKPFKCPVRRTSLGSADLRRRLAVRRTFVPWATKQPFRLSLSPEIATDQATSESESNEEEEETAPITTEKQADLPVGASKPVQCLFKELSLPC